MSVSSAQPAPQFKLGTTYPLTKGWGADGPRGLDVGDMVGHNIDAPDGWRDIAVLTFRSVTVVRNTTNWTPHLDPLYSPPNAFVEHEFLHVNDLHGYDVKIADMNGDRRRDIVATFRVGSGEDHRVGIFYNLGNNFLLNPSDETSYVATWIDIQQTGTTFRSARGLVVLDLDNDGDNDIVVAGTYNNGADRPLFIALRRTGTPLNAYTMELYKQTPSVNTGFATEIVSGKFRSDTDGYLDLAMAIEPGSGDEGLMVLVNNGPLGMALQAWDSDGAKQSWGLASGWFRPSTGVQDLAMAFQPEDVAKGYYSKNNGAPDFQVDPSEGVSAAPYVTHHSVASSLLNDDANVDFAFACQGALNPPVPNWGIALMVSDGNATLPTFAYYQLASQRVRFLKVADLNQDCRADIVGTHAGGFVLPRIIHHLHERCCQPGRFCCVEHACGRA